MKEIVAADYPMTGEQVTRDEALARFKDNPYKAEIVREIPEGEPITLYTIGEFHRSLPRRPRRTRPARSAR